MEKYQPPTIPSYDKLMAIMSAVCEPIGDEIGAGVDVSYTIPTKKPIALVFTSDWHMGNPGTDHQALNRDIQIIAATPGVYCYLGGDSIQSTLNPSFAVGKDQAPLVLQNMLLFRTLEKLQDKIVAVGTGNHNQWLRAASGHDELAEMARRLNLIYTQMGGMLRLQVGKQKYTILRVHKSRFNSSFNLTHCIKRMWEFAPEDFDIGVAEHNHQPALEPFTRHGVERLAIRTGSYLLRDDFLRSNGLMGGFSADNPTVVLYPDTRRMIGFLHMEDGISYLQGS